MKTIYKFSIAIIASMLCMLTSCEILDVEPKYTMSPDNFYQSETELIYGLTGVYGAINTEPMYGNFYSLMISNMDDLCYQSRARSGSQVYFYTHTSSDSNIYRTWSMLYAGVKNANEYLSAIENSDLDADKLYHSEARFLRAFYYFLLSQAWGDVPLRTTAATSPSDVMMAATPQEEILLWCVAEMEDCLNYITETDIEVVPFRVTRTTIQGMLARVYLFLAGESVDGIADKDAMWGKAAKYAFDVIESDKHRLNDNYEDVFINMIGDKTDVAFRESMWEAEFLGTHSSTSWSNGRIGDLIGLSSTSSDNNYSEWNCNYSTAWYNGSLRLWDLYWSEDRTADEAEATMSDIAPVMDSRQEWNLPYYNYNGSTSLNLEKSYDKTPYGYNGSYSNVDKFTAVSSRNAGKFRREVEYEGQMSAKELYTGINFPILRYADVLLMYAEAINESEGDVSTAYDYVKMVRDRAGIATLAKGDYDKESMRELIRNERGRELAFEAIRKYDLIRWGIFESEMKKYADWAADDRWKLDATAARVSETAAAIQSKHIYLPIPSIELGVNKLLKQNSMW
ncbi:MAG: RagB/SusD family nutrient uptake outer membrane protein [Rikenellaceae bacterium]